MRKDEFRLGYRADIEGLRAIAVLLVIGAHAAVPGLSGGFVGVDIFFVLSGFLITGLLIQEVTRAGSLQFGDFYLRRLRRLFPALLVMLLGSSVLAAWILSPTAQITQATTGISALGWLSNVHFALDKLNYFAAGNETNLFLHTWSLGVEEQFYLVWPALIYLVLRKAGGRGIGRLRLGMLLIALCSFAACVLTTYRQPQLAFYMMPLRAWQFALGALIWLEFRTDAGWLSKRCSSGAGLSAMGGVGLVMLLAAGCLLDANRPYPGLYALVPTVGAAMVVASGSTQHRTFLQRVLSFSMLQAIGRISYSWYLWHWPILLLGQALTGSNAPVHRVGYVLVSLLLAIASYRFVESPVRHQRWWFVHKRVALYGCLAVMALSMAGLMKWIGYADDLANSPELRRITQSHWDAPVIYLMGCDGWYRSDRVSPCRFGDPHATHTALLLGDSIAGQWFPALSKIFVRPGWRLVALTKSSCPMVDQPIFYARIGRVYTECANWRTSVLSGMGALKPDIVVMSSSDGSLFSEEQWTSGSKSVMQQLSRSVGQVYVLRSTPHLPFDGPECLAEHALRPKWLRGDRDCSVVFKDERSSRIYASLQKAATPFDNVHVLDMNDAICASGICQAIRDDKIVFRDSQHMTASFAGSLAQILGRKLQPDAQAALGNARSGM
ncbi:acyltransferase [Dyella choica]|uniref:Acyltransferase n=1 Tax=Dyella choica TaxID=1927959 RepID=A0A3S0WWV9_9GAMM|nr:acyltransferase [Dyella choica]